MFIECFSAEGKNGFGRRHDGVFSRFCEEGCVVAYGEVFVASAEVDHFANCFWISEVGAGFDDFVVEGVISNDFGDVVELVYED